MVQKIMDHFEVKKCFEMLSLAVVESRNRFLTAKSGLNCHSVDLRTIYD